MPLAVRRQIVVLAGAMFLTMVGFGIVLPVLPFFARRFGASAFEMGLLQTGWALAQFLAAPFWGLATDRIGRKPILILGLTGHAIAFLGMVFARSYVQLLGFRVAGGLLSSAVLPSGQAIAADISPPEERGGVMATMGAGFGLGFLVGPALGGALTLLGEHAPFYVAACGALAAMGLITVWVREPARDHQRASASRRGPAVLLQALRSPEQPLFLMAFAATFSGSSLFSMLGYYSIDRTGASPSTVGIMFTALGLASVITQVIFVGRLTRAWGEVAVIRLGFVTGVMGFVAVALAGTVTTIALAVSLASAGMALLRPALTSLNTRRTTLGYGTSMGMQTSFDSLGRTLGPLWAGAVYAAAPSLPFVAAGVVYAGAAAAAFMLLRPEPDD